MKKCIFIICITNIRKSVNFEILRKLRYLFSDFFDISSSFGNHYSHIGCGILFWLALYVMVLKSDLYKKMQSVIFEVVLN